MRSPESLSHWTAKLLPALSRGGHHPGPSAAQLAATQLLRALLVGFTTQLSQLARQVERTGDATTRRQYLSRWLGHRAWEPHVIYTSLGRCTRRLLHHWVRRGDVLLLVDATDLRDQWVVLQVSVCWQRRALPLYRVVTEYTAPEQTLPECLGEALDWLGRHLPGARGRYVLVLDRGFPSHPLLQRLQREGWRYVIRIKGNWKLHHPEFTGLVRDLPTRWPVGPEAQLVTGGWWGQAQAGRHCRATLVAYWGAGHATPWYLVTSEAVAGRAVGIYRQRMQIEQEFRDLKGPEGLDHLAEWTSKERVARLLAWVAVYEWRLAYLWLVQRLELWAPTIRITGKQSWITVVREWLRAQMRSAVPLTDGRL